MRLLDRYLLRHFLASYLVCLVSFLALYIVIDLFTKLDEFAEGEGSLAGKLQNVVIYYAYRLPWFFQRLSAVLSLVAGMFTLAWLERQNELLPILAAGIPVRRLLLPILLAVVGLIGVALANQELLVPRCSAVLVRSAEDPRGKGGVCPVGCYDDRLIHFEGRFAFPERRMIQYGRVTVPASVAGRMIHLSCKEMFYRPANGRDLGGWYLTGATPAQLDCSPPLYQWPRRPGVYFIETELSYERLTRNPAWFHYESTLALCDLLETEDQLPRRAEVLALLHRRLTAPLLELILVLLGIPFVLGRGGGGLYFKLGVSLTLYGVFQGFQYVCGNLAQKEFLDPMLGAWLPVLVFGPLAIALLDGVRS